MTPYIQLFRHEPENGIYGDCHRTAIGSIFNIPPGQVPHFYDRDRSEAEAQHLLNGWLATRGLTQILIPIAATGADADDDLRGILNNTKRWNAGQYYLLSGTSRTGVGHTVVCIDDLIVHDPSQTEAGIIGPLDDGCYWLTFFGSSLATATSSNSGRNFQGEIFTKP